MYMNNLSISRYLNNYFWKFDFNLVKCSEKLLFGFKCNKKHEMKKIL